MLSGKRILITGATGFVGACLLHRLVSLGFDVHIITRAVSNKWRIRDILKDVTEHDVDLWDSTSTEALVAEIRPNIIYHLAAYAAYPFQQDVLQTIHTNVLGTVNLLNACVKYGFDSFINTGSSSEYGQKKAPMKETDLLEPNSLYAVTKSAATQYCEFIGKSKGLPVATLRLFSVYGYYEEPSRLIPTVVKACLKKKNPELSSGAPVRDFVFVDDIIDLYLKLAERKDLNGIILNAATGTQHSVGEVVDTCIRLSKADVHPLWGSVPGRSWDTNIWVADIERTRTFLNWEPRYNLESGLQKTLDWFREHLDLYGD